MCAEPIGDEHPHVVNLESRGADVHLPACYLLFTDEDAAAALPGGARPVPVVPGLHRSDARQWDELEIPVGLAFFFRNSVLGRTVAFYPGPAGATESELPLAAWDADRRGQPAAATCSRPDVEALLVRRRTERGAARLAATWCRSTAATSWSAGCGCSGAASTAAGGARRLDDVLRRRSTARSRPGAEVGGPADDRSWRSPSLDIVAEPYAAAPQLTARLRVEETTGAAVHAMALRCQVRIEPQRRPLRRRGGAGLLDLFGDRGRWRDTLQAVPLDAVQRPWCRASPGRPRSTCRCRAPTTSRSPASKYLHALRDGDDPAAAPVLRHRLHPGRARVRGRAGAVGLRGVATGCRSRCGSELMDAVLPRHRLAAAATGTCSTRSPATGRRAA